MENDDSQSTRLKVGRVILGAQLNEIQNCTIEEGIIIPVYGLPNPPPSLTTHAHFATFIVLNLQPVHVVER